MTAQARTGTSGDGALSINQDHQTRELWREASEQLPDDGRGEDEKVENTKLNCKTSLMDGEIVSWFNSSGSECWSRKISPKQRRDGFSFGTAARDKSPEEVSFRELF